MKHTLFGKAALSALLVTILVGTLVGCSDSSSSSQGGAATLQSIVVTSPPTKTTYAKGAALVLTGLVVTGRYSDGTSKAETVSASNVSGYNADTLGTQTLTVTVSGKTATFTVTVSATGEGTLQSIAITAQPTKTTYAKGEALVLTGLVVTGTYSDGTSKAETVSASNVSGYNADTLGTQTLTVTVSGKTATFTVTVSATGAGTLQSIAITAQPTKTTYAKGEALVLTGLVVTGTYSDGTSKAETVSASNVSGYNADTLGTQTLTVTVSGKTATFTVTVSAAGAATLQSIAITSQPTKTDYMVGESLDLTGLVVTGTYLDGTSQVETVGASNVSGYNADTAGTQTLTVTVNDKTATFSVTVTASTPHFTISLDDPINGVESDIALSRSGAGETPASIELAITGTYAAYEWYLNIAQTPVSSTATWTVNAADCLLGKNFLTVQVRTSDGAYYAKELTVSVSR